MHLKHLILMCCYLQFFKKSVEGSLTMLLIKAHGDGGVSSMLVGFFLILFIRCILLFPIVQPKLKNRQPQIVFLFFRFCLQSLLNIQCYWNGS